MPECLNIVSHPGLIENWYPGTQWPTPDNGLCYQIPKLRSENVLVLVIRRQGFSSMLCLS